MSDKAQCIKCRWSAMLEHRYDQVHCTNGESPEAWGDVEATGSCELFQIKDQNKNMSDTPRTSNLLGKLIEEDGGLDEMNAPFVWVRLTKTLERELNAAKVENEGMKAAIKEANEALDTCEQFIKDAHIIEAQWSWEPLKSAAEALAKLQPFLK